MINLDKEYWTNRYLNNDIGWDIGNISTPLKEYFNTLADKTISILIPGAGNAYEVEYLFNNGFSNVFLLDISEEPINAFKQRMPDFPAKNLICTDFFEHQGNYDLIIEQTFFCALNPNFRENYVKKMASLLKPNGKLVGLLFNITFNADTPPYGGNEKEYLQLFHPYFIINKMEVAKNSIKPRENNELFFVCEKTSKAHH